MGDNPPCMLCNHSAEDHPIVGVAGSQSPCTKCSCPGYIANRVENIREIHPNMEERVRGMVSVEAMHAMIESERGRTFGGEATLFGQFDEHPFFGNEGQQLIRGVEPGEVPKHMRNMMPVTQGGNLELRYGREHRREPDPPKGRCIGCRSTDYPFCRGCGADLRGEASRP